MHKQWKQSQLERLDEKLKGSLLVHQLIERSIKEAYQMVEEEGLTSKDGDDYAEALEYYIDNVLCEFKLIKYRDNQYVIFVLKGDEEGFIEVHLTNDNFEYLGDPIKSSDTLDARQVDSIIKSYEQMILLGELEEE